MLNYELRYQEGILLLTPDGALDEADFQMLAANVDAYLGKSGMLHGVMVRAQELPRWKNLSAVLAHLKFVRDHHRQIEKVALVMDGGVAEVMPHVASHFIGAQVKQFDHAQEKIAWDWLATDSTGPKH